MTVKGSENKKWGWGEIWISFIKGKTSLPVPTNLAGTDCVSTNSAAYGMLSRTHVAYMSKTSVHIFQHFLTSTLHHHMAKSCVQAAECKKDCRWPKKAFFWCAARFMWISNAAIGPQLNFMRNISYKSLQPIVYSWYYLHSCQTLRAWPWTSSFTSNLMLYQRTFNYIRKVQDATWKQHGTGWEKHTALWWGWWDETQKNCKGLPAAAPYFF